MNICRLISLLIIFPLFAVNSYAQGDFIDRGESALKIGGFIPVEGPNNKLGGSAGCSIYGISDLGLSVQRQKTDKILYSKSISLHLFRQGFRSIPFGLEAGITTSSYSLGNLFSKNSYYYGARIYRNMMISNVFLVQPSFGVNILKYNWLDRDSGHYSGLEYQFGLTGLCELPWGNALYLSLDYSAYDSEWSDFIGSDYNLAVGVGYIVRNLGGDRKDYRERWGLRDKIMNVEIGACSQTIFEEHYTGVGISVIARNQDVGEFAVSVVKFDEDATGVSSEIIVTPILGGSKYKRPGLCVMAGASSVEGSSTYSGGIGLYGDIYLSKSVMLQPMAAMSIVGKPQSFDKTDPAYQFSLTLLNDISPKAKFRLDLGYSVISTKGLWSMDYDTFGFRIGFMFGGSTSE